VNNYRISSEYRRQNGSPLLFAAEFLSVSLCALMSSTCWGPWLDLFLSLRIDTVFFVLRCCLWREKRPVIFFTEQVKFTLLLTVSGSIFLSRPCWSSWQDIRLLIEYYCLSVLESTLERACRTFRGHNSSSVPVILMDQLLLFCLHS